MCIVASDGFCGAVDLARGARIVAWVWMVFDYLVLLLAWMFVRPIGNAMVVIRLVLMVILAVLNAVAADSLLKGISKRNLPRITLWLSYAMLQIATGFVACFSLFVTALARLNYPRSGHYPTVHDHYPTVLDLNPLHWDEQDVLCFLVMFSLISSIAGTYCWIIVYSCRKEIRESIRRAEQDAENPSVCEAGDRADDPRGADKEKEVAVRGWK